jgi:hypothetical protein
MALKRGFKAHGERLATGLRDKLGLKPGDPADPAKVATLLGIEIVSGGDLIGRARFEELERLQAGAFSACTFIPAPGKAVVVYNPLHPPARLASDIVHELAHVILDHRLSRLEQLNGISFLSCDVEQEEEATWLAGCLLLPRPLLMSCLLRRMDEAAIATSHGVSEKMVTYRINVTGVRRQLARARRP